MTYDIIPNFNEKALISRPNLEGYSLNKFKSRQLNIQGFLHNNANWEFLVLVGVSGLMFTLRLLSKFKLIKPDSKLLNNTTLWKL